MTSSETEAEGISSFPGRGIEAWLTPARFAALLALLICATFPEVVTGQASFFYRDFGAFTYPIAHYYRECFWRGELPLWNPLNDCGLPLLAQWNTAMLYPPSLFYLLLPLSWSLGVLGLIHLFFAGMGMFLLARRWTGNPLAAAVSGAAFAFNGLTWHMLVWISNLGAWAWMPWVVLAVEAAWEHGGARRTSIAALTGAMQMLTGAPEIIFLTWLFLLALVALKPPSRWLSMIGRLAVIALIVAGLAAAQLLPFLDLLRHSNRDPGFNGSGWAMPLSGLGTFLVPLFRCFESGQGVFVEYEQYWTPSHYAGVGIVALALVAAWRVRGRRVWLLIAAAVFGLIMALGAQGRLYPVVRTMLPQLGFMRYPIKFITLTLFALPLLAAYAIQWLATAEIAIARRSLVTVAAIIIGGIVVLVAWAGTHPLGWDNWAATWHSGAGRAVFLVLITGVLVQMRSGEAPHGRPWLLGLSLIALLWADVYTHAPKINPTVARRVFEPDLMRAQMKLDPQPQAGEPRAMPTAPAIEKARSTYLANATDDYLCRRLALFDDCNLLDGIPKTDGFFSIYLLEYDQILSFLLTYDAKGADVNGLKDFLGIGYINGLVTGSAGGLEWTNRPSALPLVTAGQKPVFADGAETVENLLKPGFNPRQTVYLPLDVKDQVTATNRVEARVLPGKIGLSAEEMDFAVDAAGPAVATVAQTYYHDWRAYVDGRLVPLWRANHAFQAIEVPAGRHQVSLVYEDRYFLGGAIISASCLLMCSVALRKPKLACPA
jgi:hypothetical protein